MSENIDAFEENIESVDLHKVVHVKSMFENWFLDYASYVILDRSVPEILDGFKPVQRRIMHSMFELEDGRYNKAANIIGNTMKYHPHGDASIGAAMVQLGQKNLLIDTQGNWGNIYTGDSAAAARYIEARLSKFALEVVFNPKTTAWKLSYDGRNKEPVALPVKFPLLLAQGVEGIAVGLASKILPHNFNELIDASIAILKQKPFEIFPDFPTGGYVDVSKYNDGQRGGKVRVRAKISIVDNKTLAISEIPFGTNTANLIEKSIVPAIEKGRLKIKKVDDNTAENVEILLHLHPGVSPDQTIDALYAFTDCEQSISPNATVIYNGKPHFMGVSDILRINTHHTVFLLTKELEIQLEELENQWHWVSLEKIFFEQKIYKELEQDRESWDVQIDYIERAFDPYRPLFKQEITREDVLKLCEKPVRKISKFDIKKAEEQIAGIEADIEEVKNHLEHIIDYAINYFQNIKKKYGKDRERKTEIKNFDTIVATQVTVANQKLYVNRADGFVGTGLKKDEYICDCSDIDEVIAFSADGQVKISKVSEKTFFKQNLIHVEVFKRNDDRTIYNLIYSDGKDGVAYVKRFAVGGVTRDKEYDLTKGTKGSKVLYLTSNPNGEAEKVRVFLKPRLKLKKLQLDFDFSTLAIKNRGSMGNILSRNAVRKIEMIEKGISTLSALKIWFDPTVMKLNTDERGNLLGHFKEADKILRICNSGNLRLVGYDLTTFFEDDTILVEKFKPQRIITVVYQDLQDKKYLVKRFQTERSDKILEFIPEKSKLVAVSTDFLPQLQIQSLNKAKEIITETLLLSDFVDIMRISAKGKRLPFNDIKSLKLTEPLPYEEPEEEDFSEDTVADNIPEDTDEPAEMDEDTAQVWEQITQNTSKPKLQNTNDEEVEQLSLF